MKNRAITTLLFDFDGVFRHFDDEKSIAAEQKYRLKPGSVLEAAFESQDYLEIARGLVTKSEWIDRTAELVGCRPAAEIVLNDKGSVDLEMMNLLHQASDAGYRTALLTNSTCSIHDELEEFDLIDSFDYLFTTHKIGVAKPDPEIFEHVCTEMKVNSSEVFFTDDLKQNVEGAIEFGIEAKMFTSVPKLRSDLELADVKISS